MKFLFGSFLIFNFVFCQPLYNKEIVVKPKYTEIRVSSDISYLTGQNGENLYLDIIKAVYEPMGIKVKNSEEVYSQSLNRGKKENTDASGALFMKEKDSVLYPKWHFGREKQMVLSYKNPENQFKDLNSLRDKTVISLSGYNLKRYNSIFTKLNKIDSIASAFSILRFGRADYFVGEETDILHGIGENKIDINRYKLDFLSYINLYLVFEKTARGKYFMGLWDKRIETLKDDINFLAIYEKYGYKNPFGE